MGMLTDFIQGAAKSASGMIDDKLKEITEQEMLKQKNQLEIEREKRVEEAKLRFHNEITRPEQLEDHATKRKEELDDLQTKYEHEDKKDDKDFEQSKGLANLQSENANRNAASSFNREKSWATDPSNPDFIKSQAESKLKQMEFEQKSQVNALYQQYQSETDPAKKEAIADSIDALTGKRAERLQKVEVQVGEDSQNKPIFQDVLYDTKRQKVVDIQGQYDSSHPKPMSESDIEALAKQEMLKKYPDGEPAFFEDSTAYDTELAGTKARLRNGSGMIGIARQQQENSNNNIGNIRSTKGSGFNQYDSVEDGVKAIDHQLELYGNGKSKATGGRKLDTLAEVISTYSPPNENDTARLISEASKRLGIAPDQKIDLENPIVRKDLTQAIIIQENGQKALTPEVMKAIDSLSGKSDEPKRTVISAQDFKQFLK